MSEARMAQDNLNRTIRTGDPLSQMDRDILGHSAARVHIPLRDPIDLRRCVSILRQLANNLEVSSHIRGDARTALFAARLHINTAAGQLRSKPRRNND